MIEIRSWARSTVMATTIAATVVIAACSESTAPTPTTQSSALAVSLAGNTNGRAGAEPAYYDDELFTINLKLLPENASLTTIEKNTQQNNIYVADDFPGFISVIDAVPGDGMNPLWREIEITFVTIAPQQFTSDEDIDAAADAGQIILTPTDEMYRCSVISG
jgi:hypothetical protein